jgi:hypothetical protein
MFLGNPKHHLGDILCSAGGASILSSPEFSDSSVNHPRQVFYIGPGVSGLKSCDDDLLNPIPIRRNSDKLTAQFQ